MLASITMLAKMVTPTSTAGLTFTRRKQTRTEVLDLGTWIHEALEFVAKELELPEKLAKRLKENKAFMHLEAFVRNLESRGQKVVCTEGTVLGILGEWKYAGTFDLLCVHEPTGEYYLIEYKSGTKPSGDAALEAYIQNGCVGPIPDTNLTRDVLQVNLQAHAVKGLPRAPKMAPRHMLVYGSPNNAQATIYFVPVIPAEKLAQLVAEAYGHITKVRALLKDPTTPRDVIHAAWGFPEQLRLFHLFPTTMAADTTSNTNKKRMPLMQVCAKDNDDKNILPAQGFLENEQTSAFVWWFCAALPQLFLVMQCPW